MLPITQSSSRNLAAEGNLPLGISTQPNIYGYVPTSTYTYTPTGIFGVNQQTMNQGFGGFGGFGQTTRPVYGLGSSFNIQPTSVPTWNIAATTTTQQYHYGTHQC